MDCQPIIDRLRTQLNAQGWIAIGGAAELDVAIEGTPGTPSLYVLPLAETPDDPYLASRADQRVLQGFGVVIVVSNARDPKGAQAQSDLQVRRLQVRRALLGWAPDQVSGDPVMASGGRLLRFAQARLWWTDEFAVYSTYTNT